MLLPIIYMIFAMLTWFTAGCITGAEFHKAQLRTTPGQQISVNWFNIFYQGLAWPAYWGAHLTQFYLKKRAH
jgi:hypothetical protein